MSELKNSKAIALVNQKVDEAQISDKQLTDQLKHFFGPLYDQAMEAFEPLKGLKVTSENQIEEMRQAREGAKALGQIRIAVEKKRKVMKSDALATGRAIDSVAGMITEYIEPAEKYLKLQADFLEIKAANDRLIMINDRRDRLVQYCPDPTMFDIGNMSEAAFETLLEGQKLAFESRQRLALEQKKTDDRIYEITQIGLVWNEEHQSFIKDDTNIAMVDVKTMSDNEFKNTLIAIMANRDRKHAIITKDTTRRQELRELGYLLPVEASVDPAYYGLMDDETYADLVAEIKEEKAEKERRVVIDRLSNARALELSKYNVYYENNLVDGFTIDQSGKKEDNTKFLGEMFDEEYETLLNAAKTSYENIQQKQRDQERQHRYNSRKLQLTEMGFKVSSNESGEAGRAWNHPDFNSAITEESLYDATDQWWDQQIDASNRLIKDAADKRDKAAKKLAKGPDRDKLKAWLDKIDCPLFNLEDLKSEESKETQRNISAKFSSFKQWALGEIEKL